MKWAKANYDDEWNDNDFIIIDCVNAEDIPGEQLIVEKIPFDYQQPQEPSTLFTKISFKTINAFINHLELWGEHDEEDEEVKKPTQIENMDWRQDLLIEGAAKQ